jgi:hypothetical protein
MDRKIRQQPQIIKREKYHIMNNYKPYNTQIKNFSFLLLAIAYLFSASSCNEERIYPLTMPTGVTIKTLSYSGIDGRVGGGDFEKDTLFEISGIPEDGTWNYHLDIGGYNQEGEIQVINSKAKFANFLRLEWWLELETNDADSVDITIELVSETLGYEGAVFATTFKKEVFDIRTWQDLQAMQYDLDGEYTLKNDIEFPEPAKDGFPEQGFMPVGRSKGVSGAFTGKLNGDGYTLKGFYINREFENFVGLFGVLSYTAEIQNLKIELSDLGITGYDYVGAIAGYADKNTVIEDCKAEGEITGRNYTGGLIGYVGDNSSVSLGRITGTVKGYAYTGGMIGYCSTGSNIEYCFSSVLVEGTDTVGGLIGAAFGNVSNCQGDSVIVNGENFTGGLVGWGGGTFNNCSVAAGAVTGDSAVGGLAGVLSNTGSLYKSCSKVSVTADIILGGLAGLNQGEIENCYTCGGQVDGSAIIGGFIGQSDNIVKNCYSNSTVGSGSITGGFIGDKSGTVTNCYWNSDAASLESVGNGDSFGIEKKSENLFTGFDPSDGGVREIFLGWDFSDIWVVLSSKNSGFPYLLIERALTIDF